MRRIILASCLCLQLMTTAVPAAQLERVPDSAVVNGTPQGIFVGRSLLTGRAVCLMFLSGGRVTRFIPAGGLEHFDWAGHQARHSGDSGTWESAGGQLRIVWGDGGVHQGPLTVREDGIEFYGKRYARPATVGVAALAGRWESTRGTAIAGGEGINTATSLIIEADGRYQWSGITGGVVAGEAAAGAAMAASGKLAIAGATATFRGDGGTFAARTFLPAAGTPVSAFSLDADMYTRAD